MHLVQRQKNRFFRLLFCAVIFFAPLDLSAQAWTTWLPGWRASDMAFIYYAQGGSFSISVQGQRMLFPADAPGTAAMLLGPSGVIETAAGASVEFQLVPSGTVIKLSENTTLVYNGIDEYGRFADLDLLRGRIRVVTGVMSSDGIQAIVVRGGRASVRITGGDVGIDYSLTLGLRVLSGMPVFHVHTFRGRAEVFPYRLGGAAAQFGTVHLLLADAGESLSLDISASHTFVEREALSSAVVAYWIVNNFAGSPPVAMPNTAIAVPANMPPGFPLPPPTAALAPIQPLPPAMLPPPAAGLPPPLPLPPAAGLPPPGLPPAIAPPPLQWEPPPAITVPNNRRKNLLLAMGLTLMVGAVGTQALTLAEPDLFSGLDNARIFRGYAYIPFGAGALLTLLGIFDNPRAPSQ